MKTNNFKILFSLVLLSLVFLTFSCSKDNEVKLSSNKAITQFKFLKSLNPGIDNDYIGIVYNNTIVIDFPYGIDATNLIPSFTISEQSKVKIGDLEQISEQTANNFEQSLTYVVTAEDKTQTSYNVSIRRIGLAPDNQINKTTSFHQYISNNLYIDLSLVLSNSLYDNYFPDQYNSRAYADFDKDGDLDIMATSFNFIADSALNVEYYQNNGGSFVKNQTVFNGNIPTYVHGRKAITGDFDNNGWTDVVIAGHGYDKQPFPGEQVKIMLNTNGVFTTKVLPLSAGFYHSVCAGDIDHDGDVDLFLTNNFSIGKFLINDGSANFNYDASLFPTELGYKSYFTSELYDLNNDGYLDLVNTGHEMDGANSVVLWGNYSGKYAVTRMTTLPKVTNYQIAIAISFMDYNNDGKMDILLIRTGDGAGSLTFYQGYYLQLLKNVGSAFEDVTASNLKNNANPNAPKWINWVRFHDIDNDGDLDLTSDDKYYNLQWINNNAVFTR